MIDEWFITERRGRITSYMGKPLKDALKGGKKRHKRN